jgi:soluble lytic murein transglycosylase
MRVQSFSVVLFVGILVSLSGPASAVAPPPGVLLALPGKDDLREYLVHPRIAPAGTQSFLRAVRAYRAGQFSFAEKLFLQTGKTTPAFSDWAYVLAADASAARGDTLAVARHLSVSSHWLAREWGWRSRVRALQASEAYARAAEVALESASSLESADGKARAKRVAAEIMLELNDTARATALLREVLRNEGVAAVRRPAANLLADVSRNPADFFQAARVLADAGGVLEATALLPRVLAQPKLAGAGRAQLRLDLARVHFDARRYSEAQRISGQLAADSAEPAEARAHARVLLGRTLLRLGNRSQAILQFERVLRENSANPAAEARFLLGDLEGNGTGSSAHAHFLQSAALGPQSLLGTESMMRLGASAFAAGQFDSARHWFERARAGATAYQQRATYWSARAREARGDTSALELFRSLIHLDPVSYYAFQAADRLGRRVLELPAGPPRQDNLENRAARAYARVDLLIKAGLFDLAAFEQERVRSNFENSKGALYAFAERMHAAGQTQRAISLGRQIQRQRGAWDQRLLRIVYPLPFSEIIRAEAMRQKVDPFLAAALIRQESAFNPRATSVAGARGLMQIMPRTGEKLARTVALPRFKAARLYEPRLNIQLGMQHLQMLLQTHSGRLPHVLSACNAGPHRLSDWLNFPEVSDDELFAERIPFAETRDYVRIVQQNAQIYRVAYGAAASVSTAPAPQ